MDIEYQNFTSSKRINTYKTPSPQWTSDKSDCTSYGGIADDWQGPGYYRFTDGAGTKLATSPVKKRHCGTSWTGYLKDGNSALPSSPGEEREATVCFHAGSSTPCYDPTSIKIKKCSNFWIFKLPTVVCNAGYCGEQ